MKVLRSILPPDVMPYTPVNVVHDGSASGSSGGGASSGGNGGYRSSLTVQTRGMEILYVYVDIFLDWITPRHLVPEGNAPISLTRLTHLHESRPI